MKSFFFRFWPPIIIVFVWFLFSFPYFFKGLVPFPSDFLVTFFPPWNTEYGIPVKNNAMPDVITQIYPWKKFTIDTWKTGQIPLWNPYSFSGTPHAGNYQSSVFSPINMLFFVFPFIDAWSIMILFQPLLAGIFMYGLIRSFGKSKEAAILASVSFMFCGFLVTWMAYGTLAYAALFLPLIFWGINKRNIIPVGIGIALSLLSGHFQTSIYVIGASLAYLLWNKKYFIIIGVVCGVLIAMPQILLGFHSFVSSTRGETILKGEVIPWVYLVTFIAPDFYGNPVTRNDWFGHYAEWAGFIGVIPLMLAFNAMRKRASITWFFIFLGFTSLLMATPTFINDFIYWLKIPVLSGSAAGRIIVLVSFSLSVLSAFGLDELVTQKKHNLKIPLLFLLIVLCIWGSLFFGKMLPADAIVIAKRNFILPTIFIFIGTLLFFIRKKFIWVMLLVIVFDMLRFAVKWMPFEKRELMYPDNSSLAYLSKHAGFDRVLGNVGSGEVGVMHKLYMTEGYDAVYTARYGEFIQAISKGLVRSGTRSVVQFDKASLYKTEALQLLGIKYIYHSFSDGKNVWVFPYWEYTEAGTMRQVYSDEKYEIFQYENVYPRMYLASSYIVASDDQKIIDTLFANTTDRRNTLILEETPIREPMVGEGTVEVLSYTPNKISVKTNSTGDKLLFVSDSYDSGWQANVDGKSTPVYRANYTFRAIAVPSGSHLIEFIYWPKEMTLGLLLSIIGVITLIGVKKNENRFL